MLSQNDKVVVACPAGTEAKFPAFYLAFHGKHARVIGDVRNTDGMVLDAIHCKDPDKQVGGWVRVDISAPNSERQTHISVDRRWLARR